MLTAHKQKMLNKALQPTGGPRTPLLQLVGLQVAYGPIQAVKGIDLELYEGELVCLIGANGAGKTTTLNTIAGLLSPSSGDIRYQGTNITTLAAHQRVRRGLALAPEGRGIFTRLSVAENLRMGAYARRDSHAIAADLERVCTLLPRIGERLDQVAGTLSGGEQQMLAIGRALLSRPRLLLLDEPSMGLAPRVVETIFELIQTIAREGVTVLLVEQKANRALQLADRAYVMDGGRIGLTGSGQELLDDPLVRRAYLGEMELG